MKILVSFVLALALVCTAVPPVQAEPHQVIQGTELHLTLLNPISSAHTKDGDPFVAVVAKPVMMGDEVVIPAGTKIHGVVTMIQPAKRFSVFRGQAYMSVSFKTMEVDSRLVPIEMSILGIGGPRVDGYSKQRHDIKISEGEVLQEKHDIKGDAIGMAIGGGGGSLIGAIAGNALRGFGIGFGAGAVYVVSRKGKEIDMPAQTGMLVRMDNTVTVPGVSASSDGSSTAPQGK